MLEKMANILLTKRGLTRTPKKVGVNWIRSFLSRNLDLKPKFARRLAYNRAICEGPILINGFFESLLLLKTGVWDC
jgi:hypothetical protein